MPRTQQFFVTLGLFGLVCVLLYPLAEGGAMAAGAALAVIGGLLALTGLVGAVAAALIRLARA